VSLLLDALRKAEKAKEAAQGGSKAKTPGAGGLSLEPTVEEEKRVMTRDKLPDISTPLEIGSEDLAPRRAAAKMPLENAAPPAAPATPGPSATGSGRPARPASGGGSSDSAARRAAAQTMLQAQFKEPNPKLPFYITMGVLGVFAIGTIVYFYLQLRPRPPLVNANPAPSAQVQVAAAPAPAPRAPAPRLPSGQTIPGLPGGASAQPASATAPTTSSAAAPTAAAAGAIPAAPAPAAKPVAPAPAPSAQQPTPTQPTAAPQPTPAPAAITRTTREARSGARTNPAGAFGRRTVARVNPGVAAGYAAYEAGDLAAARHGYQEALRSEPRNIDALLGMAAVEVRAGQYAAADRYYQQVLRLDPPNPYANAGMLALRNQQVNPVAGESRVKSLMAREPDAEALQFTLGNQYAQQGRWNEAQQAYFKALAADPKNPDFAYNLAVSLDHLRQASPALQHYRLALKLAETRRAGFDVNAVRARIAQLAH
jgi:tetratricopeptide (TPR) repeat protein